VIFDLEFRVTAVHEKAQAAGHQATSALKEDHLATRGRLSRQISYIGTKYVFGMNFIIFHSNGGQPPLGGKLQCQFI
jgi:hypothetical protein